STDKGTKVNLALEIVQSLGQYLMNEQPFDIKVIVGDRKFECHRLILSAHSGYFRTEFNNNEEQKHEIHLLGKITSDVFELIHDTMYTGLCNVTDDNAIDLLTAADYLQISILENECVRYIDRYIDNLLTLKNCMNLYLNAKKRNLEKVKSIVWSFILVNFISLCKTDEFLDLSEDDVLKLVQSQDLVAKSEDNVVDAILFWIDKKPNKNAENNSMPINTTEESSEVLTDVEEPAHKRRRGPPDLFTAVSDGSSKTEYFLTLFTHVKLFLVSQACLNKLKEHPLFREDCKIKDLIINALSYHAFINNREVYWPANATHRKNSQFVHAVLIKSGIKNDIEGHQVTTSEWFSFPFQNDSIKTTHLKLAAIDNSLYAFGIAKRSGIETRLMDLLKVSQYLNGQWSDYIHMSLDSKIFSIVVVYNFIYIFSPVEQKFWRLDSISKTFEEGMIKFPSDKPIDYVMHYHDFILAFYSEASPHGGMGLQKIYCYDIQEKPKWSLLTKNFPSANLGMTSFNDEVNTYILQSNGQLWKIVTQITSKDIVQFEPLGKLWDIDWPLYGVVIVMDELYIYGVISPEHENSSQLKTSVLRFRKINYIYYKNSTENSTFAPFIFNTNT
uniref:BTB domain-containing protein n=1 Tax=Biomphalaria glabrata TaxID=6526 RepID=A0A2C9M758_BIOGL